jgi:hypothetical protein
VTLLLLNSLPFTILFYGAKVVSFFKYQDFEKKFRKILLEPTLRINPNGQPKLEQSPHFYLK